MEKIDLEAMRSRYSDLTVTPIPKGAAKKKKPISGEPDPQVEITRVVVDRSKENKPDVANTQASVAVLNKKRASMAYRKEIAAAVTKLEEVMFQQSQLAMLTKALPFHVDGHNAITNSELRNGHPRVQDMYPGMPVLDSNHNIDKKYTELLDVVSGMRKTIPLCLQGLRIPKERLYVDINNARSLVRECKAILEHDI